MSGQGGFDDYLFRLHPQPMWVYDPQTLAFIAVNDAAVQAYGWTREEFLSMTLRDIRPPEDIPALESAVRRKRSQTTRSERWRHLRRDGSLMIVEVTTIDLEWRGRPGRLTTTLDVTEQVRAQEEVRESEEQFRLMVEGSEQVFFFVHDEAGIFRYLSPSVEAVLGYPPDALVGRHFSVLDADPAAGSEVAARTAAAIESGRPQPTFIAHSRHRDGHDIPVEVTERPVVRDGRIVGVQGFARDFTDRHRLQQQLLQAQKLEAIGRLAGGIAHDFNNLLTAIRGHADLLLDQVEYGGAAYLDVSEICRSADRATTLTRQLLAFSRKQVLKPRVIDLGDVVCGLQLLLDRLISSDIQLELDVADGVHCVRADPGQVEQVVMNLVVNARDAMRGGGRMRLRVGSFTPDAAAGAWSGQSDGPWVELAVSDTGSGIRDADLPHIFEPFFTTKGAASGTGLGLATVYGIVTQSGGQVLVESEPGGTTFRVLLPAVDEPPAAKDTAPALESVSGTETVLVVDDDAAVRSLTCRILRSKGYHVIEAADGAAALGLGAEQVRRIDLVVTDIVMPRMSGVRLARELREMRPGLPVLYMSGHAQELVDFGRPLDPGEAFIEKPFTPLELTRHVRSLVEHRILES